MNTPQIEIDHLSFRYDKFPVLSNISFTINQGDFLGITGPNGGGKTSLLRIILGLMTPSQGRVIFYDQKKVVPQLQIGYLPQKNVVDYQFPITVREVIASGLLREKKFGRDFTSEQKNRIEEILDKMELTETADRPIGNLSGGQQQRALFGRALVAKPAVLILDEPTSYIDKNFENRMKEILREVNRTTTILFVSHDTEGISQLATLIIRINETLEIVE